MLVTDEPLPKRQRGPDAHADRQGLRLSARRTGRVDPAASVSPVAKQASETTTVTCYRHSDRETGVSCSNCGRPICPDCMTPTPVGMRCPECSKQKTKVRTAATLVGTPQLTYVLIAINVASSSRAPRSAGR